MGLVTTARHHDLPDDAPTESLPPDETFAAPADPPPERLHTASRSWDKEATHTRDLDSYFPINRLRELAAAGRLGSVAPRFYGIPTVYSQRRTREGDAPALLDFMRQDEVDVALLVPL